jgi:thiamine-phosphate pyrophosphorylase
VDEQLALLRVGLGDRREHPGRCAGGAGAEVAAVKEEDLEAALTGAPGDRQADDAAADDGHVCVREVVRHARSSVSLRRGAEQRVGLAHSAPMSLLERRRQRLAHARLYLVCDARPGGRPLEDVLAPALRGGVDVFQLRCKDATDEEILAAAAGAREWCEVAGALFILNDRPDLVAAAGADGVHVGQDDAPVAEARRIAGPDALVGLSTHTPEQIDAGTTTADYIGVGPVHATPTKPGRVPVGLDLVTYAARNATVPWFAIGGVDEANLDAVMTAGANRAAVVRAIAESPDPEGVARRLGTALDAGPPNVRRPRKSSAERAREIQATLEPLAPGERPTPLLVAVVTAVALGIVNLVLAATGHSGKGGAGTLIVYCALMFAAAWGMWAKRYVAVLLFQILLAILVVFFFLFLMRASSVGDVALSLGVIVPAGWLFWKLVRVLARLQVPPEHAV